MKNRAIIFILFVIILILLSSCKGESFNPPKLVIKTLKIADKPSGFKFEKLREIKINEVTKDIFNINSDNKHIFLKYKNHKSNTILMQFNNELIKINERTIKYGQGPGDALLSDLYFSENEIILNDYINRKVTYFDKNFNILRIRKVLRTKSVTHARFGMYYIPNYKKFTSVVFENKGRTKNEFTMKYSAIIRDFEDWSKTDVLSIRENVNKNLKKNDRIRIGTPLDILVAKRYIYVLDMVDYKISRFLLSNLQKEIEATISFRPKSFSDDENITWLKEVGIHGRYGAKRLNYFNELAPACFIIEIGNGVLVGRRDNYSPVLMDYITADYFDYDLNYLGKLKLPCFPYWNEPTLSGQMDEALITKLDNFNEIFIVQKKKEEEYYLTKWRIISNE